MSARYQWRWKALTVWIVIFTIAVGYALREGSRNTQNLEHQADVLQAQQIVLAFNQKILKANQKIIKASDAKQLQLFTKVICAADKQVQTSKQRTAPEKEASASFNDSLLASINAPPCDRTKY